MTRQWKRHKDASRKTLEARLRMGAAALFLGAVSAATSAAGIAVPAGERYVGQAAEDEQVQFALTLPWQHQDELNTLIQQLYTPGSPQYHKFLTSAQFDQRFAPSQAQYDTLKSLAQQYGLTIRGESSSRTVLGVSAPVSAVRNVFRAQLHVLQTREGKRYVAPDREADVPFPIQALGAEVVALSSKPLVNHMSIKGLANANASGAGGNAGTGSGGSYVPADIKTAYNANSIQNGGEAVAVYELSSATYADSATYASKYGLLNTALVQKKVDGGTTDTSGAGEVMLDIELIMAIAQPGTIYVYTGPNSASGALDTYTQIANDNLVHEVSTSWGLDEASEGSSAANAENTQFTKMVAEGMALFAAAGDCGAYDSGATTLNVDDPGSNPNVTSVGGTNLVTTSAQQYTSETPWATPSDTRRCQKGAGGGGGISSLWGIPSYQQGIVSNAPSGQFSTTKRNVPDVSLDADPATGYLIYDSVDGGWLQIGGTSAAAPLWAGFWSLVSHGAGKPAGFANPTLYTLGKNATTHARDFHDVTSGTNLYYSAVTGYDDATGWGSYNAANLYADAISTINGSSSSSSSGGSSSSSSSSSGGAGSSSSSSSGGGSSSSSSSGGSSSSSSSSGGTSSSSSSGGTSSSSSSGGTSSGGTVLQNGVAISNISGAQGQQLFYTITVPAGATNLSITTSGGTGDADLYVKFGAKPTTASYDCRPYITGNNESCSFASPQAGTYYIMLNGYAAFSGLTLKASYGTTTALQNGVPVTGLSGASGSKAYYSITVPSGSSSLTVAISGGTGDADLYVKQGSTPTTSSYSCRPYLVGNNESCTFSAPSGTYYIMLNGYAAYSGVTLKGTYN